MGARGPVPDPKKQTARLGRPVRRRRTTVVPFPTASIDPPETLGVAGREFWSRYVVAPWIEPADHGALERLCMIYDELDEFGSVVDRDGPQVLGSKAQPVAHPLLAVIDRWRTAAERLEGELGLTPMARQRMHIRLEPSPPPGKLAKYLEEPYARLLAQTHTTTDPRDRLVSDNGHTLDIA